MLAPASRQKNYNCVVFLDEILQKGWFSIGGGGIRERQ
jgi:hypothetical protein